MPNKKQKQAIDVPFKEAIKALLSTEKYITKLSLVVLVGYKEETEQIIATRINLSFDGYLPNERKIAILEKINQATPILTILPHTPMCYPISIKVEKETLELYKFKCEACENKNKCKKCRK